MSNGGNKTERIDIIDSFDPSVVGRAATKGTIFRYIPAVGSPILFIKDDEGFSTNWITIGGGSGGSFWKLTGNPGSGNILGSTSYDDWDFISNNVTRGGFKKDGQSYLKTHPAYPDSEKIEYTNAVISIGAAPTTIFQFTVPDQRNGRLSVNVQGRRTTGTSRAAFTRDVMFYREGGAAQLSSKVHDLFTDKTDSGYNVMLTTSGNDIVIKVKGILGHNLYWSGSLTYQMIGVL